MSKFVREKQAAGRINPPVVGTFVDFATAIALVEADPTKSAWAFEPEWCGARLKGGLIYTVSCYDDDPPDPPGQRWRVQVSGGDFRSYVGVDDVVFPNDDAKVEECKRLRFGWMVCAYEQGDYGLIVECELALLMDYDGDPESDQWLLKLESRYRTWGEIIAPNP